MSDPARNELEMLSTPSQKPLSGEWGYIRAHPYKKEVRLDNERGQKARDRYIEDWEIAEALALKPMRKRGSIGMIQA